MTDDGAGARAFAAGLRELRRAAGEPTYQELARRTSYGRSTVHDALAGRRLPALDLTLAVVGALGGDVADWRERWVCARGALDPGPADGIDDAGPSDGGPAGSGPSGRPPPPPRRRRVLVAAAAVAVAALVTGAVAVAVHRREPVTGTATGSTPSTSTAGRGCQSVPRYRISRDGNVLAAADGMKIGTVRDGDLVDALGGGGRLHPFRYLVVVERTSQVGTVDAAKLDPAGTACVAVTPAAG